MAARNIGPGRAIQRADVICQGAQGMGIDVRIGLHAGEVEGRGDDIAGIAADIAVSGGRSEC